MTALPPPPPRPSALAPPERSADPPSPALTPRAAARLALHGALLESRQRWQDLASLAVDFVFETDANGRFTFLWPERIAGHAAADLIGRRAAILLLGAGVDPFARREPLRRQRVWLLDAAGRARCFAISLAPIGHVRGHFAGLRGVANDVTEEEQAATTAAAGLRRAALLDALAETVRCADTPQEALRHGLAALRDALGCSGAAMIAPQAEGLTIRNANGSVPVALLDRAAAAFATKEDWCGRLEGEQPAALMHHHGRPPAASLVAVWRAAGGREWDAEDRAVLRSMAATLGAVLGFARLQEAAEHQALTDPLTGLANRRAFRAALESPQAGALLLLDLDNLKPINDFLGHEAGDAALRAVADMLRRHLRPGETAARLGGDEFALWLPGMGAGSAIARAEALLRAETPTPAGSDPSLRPRFSLGLALREDGGKEGVEALLARADRALYAAKRAGGGTWRSAEPRPS